MEISNLTKALQKCEIYYKDALISKEKIIEKYILFVSSILNSKDRTISLALHTGSLCFDMISFVATTLVCLSYNLATNDDIIATLQIGDMVMYKNERYHWQGIKQIDNKDCWCLEQDPKGKNGPMRMYVYEENKHLIKPYYGTSKFTDGRGIRRLKTHREEFLSDVFNISIQDVPSIIEISIVIIAKRQTFAEMCKNLKIVYSDKKQIGILDIVPAAYYTNSGKECQFGKNPTKAEPVLKVTEKISVARDLILSKCGNKTVGLLATNIDVATENSSELSDLLRRKVLKFIHITSPIQMNVGNHILDMCNDIKIFACTKEYLINNQSDINQDNSFTIELSKQILNIINVTVSKIPVAGGWSWDEYKKIRDDLNIIRESSWSNESKDYFILSAHCLLNLFISSFFTMTQLETAINDGCINAPIISPATRIYELRNIANKAGIMEEKCISIVNTLEDKYNELKNVSPKGKILQDYLSHHTGQKIAIIVPKTYYIVMLPTCYKNGKISCTSFNRFNPADEYDAILVLGDIFGKRFDPLQCKSAKTIDILLYDCENKFFNYRKKKQEKFEHKLNAKNYDKIYAEQHDLILTDNKPEENDEPLIQDFLNLEQFVAEKINDYNIRNILRNKDVSRENTLFPEIKYVGTFVSGEQILFSKNYSAVVYDQEKGSVTEVSIDKLISGNWLVFTKRNDYTKNIVDVIFERLRSTKKLSQNIIDAYEKTIYWKSVLKKYKEEGDYTYRSIAKQLKEIGSTLQEVTIREWLVEDSHTVGPRDIKTIENIGKLTQDSSLINDAKGYDEACRIVRRERRMILKLITKAINDKLSGHTPQKGSELEIVYNNVDNLSEILELESIYELDESVKVNINLVNRPITAAEVLM